MSLVDKSEVPGLIGIYYDPEYEMSDISVGEEEFCRELLAAKGFHCIAGAAGSSRSTVRDLAQEARGDSPRLSNDDGEGIIVTGPNPYVDGGVGIWSAN